MNRRTFLQSIGAGAAVASVPLSLEAEAPLPQMVAQQRERLAMEAERAVVTTTDLTMIAAYVIEKLAGELEGIGHRSGLITEVHNRQPGMHNGIKIGETRYSYPPGRAGVASPVTVSHQHHVLMLAPSERTGKRQEAYSIMEDRLFDVPEVVALPVELQKLTPVIISLRNQILAAGTNLFSTELCMPRMGSPEGPHCEDIVGLASATTGMSLRVMRQLVRNEIVMRFDMMGGRYDTERQLIGEAWLS